MDFRSEFIKRYIESLEHKTTHVQPIELGILSERYSQLYDQNPENTQKQHIFEQLCVSLELWLIHSSKDINPDDDIAYIQIVTNVSNHLKKIQQSYKVSFETDKLK